MVWTAALRRSGCTTCWRRAGASGRLLAAVHRRWMVGMAANLQDCWVVAARQRRQRCVLCKPAGRAVFRRRLPSPTSGTSALAGGGGAPAALGRHQPARRPHRGDRRVPAFSYILGDNHPHVAAMPFCHAGHCHCAGYLPPSPGVLRSDAALVGTAASVNAAGMADTCLLPSSPALCSLSTWDFPPYWLLTVTILAAVLLRPNQRQTGTAATNDAGAAGWRALT